MRSPIATTETSQLQPTRSGETQISHVKRHHVPPSSLSQYPAKRPKERGITGLSLKWTKESNKIHTSNTREQEKKGEPKITRTTKNIRWFVGYVYQAQPCLPIKLQSASSQASQGMMGLICTPKLGKREKEDPPTQVTQDTKKMEVMIPAKARQKLFHGICMRKSLSKFVTNWGKKFLLASHPPNFCRTCRRIFFSKFGANRE